MTTSVPVAAPILLFDGICRFCSRSALFALKHDRTGRIKLASMQSPPGHALLRQLGLPTDRYETFVFIADGRVHLRSDAFFALIRHFGFCWRLCGLFRIAPRGLRDWLYDRVARNRYRLFGRRESCLLPTPDIADRFL